MVQQEKPKTTVRIAALNDLVAGWLEDWEYTGEFDGLKVKGADFLKYRAKQSAGPIVICKAIEFVIDCLENYKVSLETQALEIKELDPIFGTTYWRPDKAGKPKYLYIHHPAAIMKPRRREYIGGDQYRIAAALDRVTAGLNLKVVEAAIGAVERRIDVTGQGLGRVINQLTGRWIY